MVVPTKIQHPLLKRSGASQRKREANALSLRPEFAPIDGRSWIELLEFIHNYARQVSFQELRSDTSEVEFSNWLSFFEDSLPFRLAKFHRIDLDQLERNIHSLVESIELDPQPENLQLLLDFCFNELIDPFRRIYRIIQPFDFDLNLVLEQTIRGLLLEPVLRYITLNNTAGKYLCTGKRNFFEFSLPPWSLSFNSVIEIDETIQDGIPGGTEGAVLWFKDELVTIFLKFAGAIRQFSDEIPGFIEESLYIEELKKRHEPHLGLLFAFVHLFRLMQGDLNLLTQRHLDFFYKQVLKIKPKGLVADHAHVIFEIGNHLKSYLVEKDTAFKDGKDATGADILFHLDEQIVIDKAAIKDLKTLFINRITAPTCLVESSDTVIEGIYIASKADTADGIEIPFEEDQSKNWSTLGAKKSKLVLPDPITGIAQDHPPARLGFALSSPSLWLNEGDRHVKVSIMCRGTKLPGLLLQCANNEGEYFFTQNTLYRIEALLSPEARTYLSRTIAEGGVVLKGDTEEEINRWLNQSFTLVDEDDDSSLDRFYQFSASEKWLLRIFGIIVQDKDEIQKLVFNEIPLTSLQENLEKKLDSDGSYTIVVGNTPNAYVNNILQSEYPEASSGITADEREALAHRITELLERGSTYFELYCYSKKTLDRIEGFISKDARTYLELILTKTAGVFPEGVSTIDQWLNLPYRAKQTFTTTEKNILKLLGRVEINTEDESVVRRFVLDEMPLQSLITHLDQTFSDTPFHSECVGTRPIETFEDIFSEVFGEKFNKAKSQFQFLLDMVVDALDSELKFNLGPNINALFFSPQAEAYITYLNEKKNGVLCDTKDLEGCLSKPFKHDDTIEEELGFSNTDVFRENEKEILRHFVEIDDVKKEIRVTDVPLFKDIKEKLKECDPNKICFDQELWDIIEAYRDEQTKYKYLISLLKNLDDWFTLHFSGPEGWYKPEQHPVLIPRKLENNDLVLEFNAHLTPDEPAVVFYDAETLQEDFTLKHPYPLVKVELNPKYNYYCKNDQDASDCCLEYKDQDREIAIALYNEFKNLTLQDIQIDVEVCELKQLVVQNEINIQSVDELIEPFGIRPRIGAEFFIGSKEIFCKNWTELCVAVTWKDRPEDFAEHYKDYFRENPDTGESETVDIDDSSFKVNTAILSFGEWRERLDDLTNPKSIFVDRDCPNCTGLENRTALNQNNFKYQRADFKDNTYVRKQFDDSESGPLLASTRNGFLRLALSGEDFQHEQYAFVLAAKLIKLAGLIDPRSVETLAIKFKALKNKLKEIALRHDPDAELDTLPLPPDATAPAPECGGFDFPTQSKDYTICLILKKVKETLDDLEEILERIKPPVSDAFPDTVHELINAIRAELAALDIPGALTLLTTLSGLIGDLIDPPPAGTLLHQLGHIPKGIKGSLTTVKDALDDLNKDLVLILSIIKDMDEIIPNPPTEDPDDNVFKGTLSVPKEPYTPIIKSIAVDYKASSSIDEISLIHLYPFDNSSRPENIHVDYSTIEEEDRPRLFPLHENDGTLFIGLDNVRPGSIQQLLFQLAEATADSESGRAKIKWHYLAKNQWHELRPGFEILNDATDALTRSGVVKLALPREISNNENTLMPPIEEDGRKKHLYWLKVSAKDKVPGVAETIGVHTQAARTTYKPDNNDPRRVGTPLTEELITQPAAPDFNIKSVIQPYESFGGQLPEEEANLYTRISEHLRHKGRSVDTFDYEHLVLEAFPEIFKCKCITHTMGLSANTFRRDLEVAPGYLIIAVIPDLTMLKAGDLNEPKAPVSLLQDIKKMLKERGSPFARIRVMNPRYEKITVNATIRLQRGRDEEYHNRLLEREIMQFLAPWHLGDSDKISFGQEVTLSDLIGFVESREYVDFIFKLQMLDFEGTPSDIIQPKTARSIVTGGKVTVQPFDDENCSDSPSNEPELPREDSPEVISPQ